MGEDFLEVVSDLAPGQQVTLASVHANLLLFLASPLF